MLSWHQDCESTLYQDFKSCILIYETIIKPIQYTIKLSLNYFDITSNTIIVQCKCFKHQYKPIGLAVQRIRLKQRFNIRFLVLILILSFLPKTAEDSEIHWYGLKEQKANKRSINRIESGDNETGKSTLEEELDRGVVCLQIYSIIMLTKLQTLRRSKKCCSGEETTKPVKYIHIV